MNHADRNVEDYIFILEESRELFSARQDELFIVLIDIVENWKVYKVWKDVDYNMILQL